jgi:hypothetical protein
MRIAATAVCRVLQVFIKIARAVKVTLLGSEVQALNPGEIYDVAPAIGQVLVSDGWAIEMVVARRDLWSAVDTAHDDPDEGSSAL